MAQLGGTFDATTVAPSGTRTLIPAGSYPAHILRSDMIDNKAGNGTFLWLEIEILDGDHKGQTLETRLNLRNPNPKAVEIAERDLSAICHAIGEMNVSDSSQLEHKPFSLVVKVKPAELEPDGSQKYGPQSEVAGYKKLTIGEVARPAPVAQPAARPATGFGAGAASRPTPPAGNPATTGAVKANAPWNTPRAAA